MTFDNGRLRMAKSLPARLLFGAAALVVSLSATLSFAQDAASSGPDKAIVQRAQSGDLDATYELGNFYANRRREGDLDVALGLFHQVLGKLDSDYGPQNEYSPMVLERIASTLGELGRHSAAATAAADRVARLRQADPNSTNLAHALVSQASIQRLADSYEDAIAANIAARGIFVANLAKDPWNALWVGATFFNEGINRRSLRQMAEAGSAFGNAAKSYRALADGATGDLQSNAASFLDQTLDQLVALAGADNSRIVELRQERAGLLRRFKPGGEELAANLFELGKALAILERQPERLAAFDEALAIRRANNASKALISDTLWERGVALYYLDRKPEAIAVYRDAIANLDRTLPTTNANLAILWENVASAAGDLNDQKTRREALSQRIHYLRQSQADPLALANALQLFSQASLALGEYADAEKASVEEVGIRRKLQPGAIDLAIAVDGLGRARFAAGDYTTAANDFREAIDIALAADPKTKAQAISSRIMLGVVLYMARDYDRAIEELEASLKWVDSVENPDKQNQAAAIGNLADLAQRLGRYAQSEKLSDRQIGLLREVRPGSPELAWALATKAQNFYWLARFDEALVSIREAEKLFLATKGVASSEYMDAIGREGWILEGDDRFEEALKVHQENMRLAEAAKGKESLDYASALTGYSWTLRRMDRFKEAEPGLRETTRILEKLLGPQHNSTAISYVNLAIVTQLLGNNEEAIRLDMKALAVINRDTRTTMDEQRWAYETLSLAFRDLGDTKRAILFAKQAINVQQKLRSYNKEYSKGQMQGFRDRWRRLYETLANLLISEGRISEAQAVLAMEKEEELVEFIKRDSSADLRDTQSVLTSKEEAVRGEVDAMLAKPMEAATLMASLDLKKQTGALSADEEKDYATLNASLDVAYQDFMEDVDAFLAEAGDEDTAVQREVDAINLSYTASVQDELRAFEGRAAMLQIASLGDKTHIFLTVPEASIHRTVDVPRERLTRMVFDALDAIENRSPDAQSKLGELYEVLIRPVEADLRATKAKTVMLNLQGFLRYVPFAALYDGKRYLVEDYALSIYTPAARTRFEATDRDAASSAGFGTTAAYPGFAALPGVAREMQAIFGGNGSKGALAGSAMLDASFTRDQLRDALKKRPSIVHVASHFKLVPGKESDSYLLLGDGTPLSLEDIRKGRGFRFGGVDLLTLSACETARGGGSEGDEVESFGALAQMNGASAVMATLWPVADEATASIMQSFYRHMVEGKLDKAEALRAAQIEAIRGMPYQLAAERGAQSLEPVEASSGPAASSASHPYFWSPFVLMGNWL